MAKGRERSQKFYFKNEKEVMNDLGLTATKGSGSSWIEKEDGENDFILAQLKSTDKQSYKLNKLDIEKLEHHALIANKVPVFILQFLQDDSRYALVAIEDIPLVAEYINTGKVENVPEAPQIDLEDIPKKPSKPKIKSSSKSRDSFYKQKEKEMEDRKWKKK